MEVSGRRESGDGHQLGDGHEILCQPCHGDGDNVHADGYCETCNEYFCCSCLKVHRKQSATKNHVIKSKDVMPMVQVQSDPCSELCAVHKREIVKFFCQDHNTVGCSDCMVLHHKTCSVHLVPDVSSNYDNSQEFKRFKQAIEHLEKEIASYNHAIQQNLKTAEETKAKVITEIKAFRKDLDRYLDRVEADLIQEVEELNTKDTALQNELQAKCDLIEKEMEELKTKLDDNSDKINQLFVTAKQSQERVKICQTTITDIASKIQTQLLHFDAASNLISFMTKQTPFGKVTMNKRSIPLREKKSLCDRRTQFVKEIKVKGKDNNECLITGLATVSHDEILLADFQNNALKIVNIRTDEITCRSAIKSAPWDVTMIDSDTAAVTLVNPGEILFVSTKRGLSETRRLKIRRGCKGIDHHNGLLAVSFEHHPAVQVLNMDGNVLHEVQDTSMLKWPTYIAMNSDQGSIFVSDTDSAAVYEFTIDCVLKNTFKYKDMKQSKGLAVTNDGTVVVCDERTSGRLYIIKPGTRELLHLNVHGVSGPFAILVCEEQNKMYICDRYVNFIKVYDVI